MLPSCHASSLAIIKNFFAPALCFRFVCVFVCEFILRRWQPKKKCQKYTHYILWLRTNCTNCIFASHMHTYIRIHHTHTTQQHKYERRVNGVAKRESKNTFCAPLKCRMHDGDDFGKSFYILNLVYEIEKTKKCSTINISHYTICRTRFNIAQLSDRNLHLAVGGLTSACFRTSLSMDSKELRSCWNCAWSAAISICSFHSI